MLASNSNVSAHLKTVNGKVQSDFAKLDTLKGTMEDVEALFTAYEMALTDQRNMYMQDLCFQTELKSNPYTSDYTYGHFLQLLKLRYEQASTLEEREMLRLKYYPLFNKADATNYDWKLPVDTLALQVNEDPSWVATLMNIITFGQYNRKRAVLTKVQTTLPAPINDTENSLTMNG